MMNNKPNLFIVGAMKAGTTSLYDYLTQHPDIYMSPIKEPHYFGKDICLNDFREDYRKKVELDTTQYFKQKPLPKKHCTNLSDLNDYEMLFKDGAMSKIKGEASVGYLYSKFAAQEIYNYNPDAKIIIILRNPIERTLSHYFMDYASGIQKTSDVLKAIHDDFNSSPKGWGISNLYIEASFYKTQVQRFSNLFDEEQLIILNFEDLKSNTEELLKSIFSFLHIKEVQINTSISNQTAIPKNKLIKSLRIIWRLLTGNRVRIPNIIKKHFVSKKKPEVPKSVYTFLRQILKYEIDYYNTLFN